MKVKLAIKPRMAQLGLTSKEVARHLKISQTNFSLMINGHTKSISFWMISELCNILNCTPNDLFEVVDDKGQQHDN